jgi:farnesyl diphosphate synthase
VTNANLFAMARTILLRIGHCFQVQDDYLDCYGDPEVTGKVGTDIEDGKCSWLIVMAMQRATRNQREELKVSLGSFIANILTLMHLLIFSDATARVTS